MIQPLDLQTIFVNYLAGGIDIFFFLFIIFMAYLAARFRMPNQVSLVLFGLFIVMMAYWFSLLYALLIFIVGLFFYYVLSKMIKN